MKRKSLSRLLAGLALAAMIVSAAGAFWIRREITTPYRAYSEPKLAITIAPGTSLSSISFTLQSRGVVQYAWVLRGIFMWNRTQGQSKAGDYVFDRPMTPVEVYEKLMKGETQYTVVTIPEGSGLSEIRQILASRGVGDANSFQSALRDPEVLGVLRSIEPLAPGPEGFLFPDTYFLGKNDTVTRAVLVMLHEFSRHYGEAERKQAAALGMTTLQVVTLASMVEKETAQPSERPMISGVFHNRLKLGMLMQCDPTVIYALQLKGLYRGFLTRDDLKVPSPYNTYATAGLPPGPICSPGAASLQAALYPEKTDKLYFVSRNDGTHYFSASLAEHNRAVQKYRHK